VTSLFDVSDVSPASSSSLSRTLINNVNKSTSNSNQASPLARSTISNISSTLEKSLTDDDELQSDDYSTEEEQEENLPATRQVQESTSNMDDEVQILLNKEKNLDLDQLQAKYEKLDDRYKRVKKELSALKVKHTELQQNTIRELVIVILIE
jgi:hypothetical protein